MEDLFAAIVGAAIAALVCISGMGVYKSLSDRSAVKAGIMVVDDKAYAVFPVIPVRPQ